MSLELLPSFKVSLRAIAHLSVEVDLPISVALIVSGNGMILSAEPSTDTLAEVCSSVASVI